MKIVFREEQKFTQWWLWLILISIGSLILTGLLMQLFLGLPFGNKPMSNAALIAVTFLVILLIGLLKKTKLKTHIDERRLHIHFYPFFKKKTSWNEVKKAEVVDYGFVGGWGIRPWTKYGTVFNIRGRKGLAVELTNGKKYLIGTQKEDELRQVVETFRHHRASTNL
ncbi:MAG: hypothetical protein ACQERC_04245 [Bacteroidota bacterium]